MRKIISFVHISLDGFVAGPNEEMNWIRVDEEIFDHVGSRVAKTDTAMYGRKTFEMMQAYWPTAGEAPDASKHDLEHSAWYKKANKIVLSTTLRESDFTNTKIIRNHLSKEINELKRQAGGDILLFGSPTATHSLVQQNLVDGYWLFVNPIVLGAGVALFTGVKEKTSLVLQNSHRFSSGVVALDYYAER